MVQKYLLTIVACLFVFSGSAAYATSHPSAAATEYVGSKKVGALQGEYLKVATTGIYQDKKLTVLIGEGVTVIFGLLGIIFLGFLIYAGFIWLTDQGKETEVDRAKKIIKNSVTGLIVIFVSYIVTVFVMNTLQSVTVTAPPEEQTGASNP